MAKLVLDVAQTCMDDFFQEFRPANAFFDLPDFATRVVDASDKMLDNEFLILWSARKKIEVNPQWSSHVFPKVEKDEQGQWLAKVCEPLYEFPRDNLGMGIQDVMPFGVGCAEFVRISTDQIYSLCLLPPTQTIFYAVEGCSILLFNFFGCCEKLDARVILSQSGLPMNQRTVPDGKAADIRQIVMAEMFTAYQQKLGKISAHNDNNPNPAPNETSQVYRNLKTE